MRALIHPLVMLLCGLSAPVFAQPEAERPLVVGVYAPRAYFANSPARTRQAEAIAQLLQRATGIPMKGRGFTSRGELRAKIASGDLQFAVVEAQFQVESGLPALAQARSKGKPTRAMALVVAPSLSGRSVSELRGKRLAKVSVGNGDMQVVHNLFLSGEIAGTFFGKARTARDVQGALSLVRLGKADAAFSFAGLTGGLPEVLRTQAVPLPVFVQTDPSLPPETVRKVKAALRGARLPAGGAYDAFGVDVPSSRNALRAALKKGVSGPAGTPRLAPSSAALPSVPSRLRPYEVHLPPGPVAPAMVVPTAPADRY